MAITNIRAFAHLSDADVEALAVELDQIRRDVEADRGDRDARYIRSVIRFQRGLEVSARLLLFASRRRGAWWLGAGTLGVAKIVENMEIGHNVMHGQWDWMNDPEIHSSTWEWDNPDPSAHWKQVHNHIHHKFTNVLGMDDDVGYGVLRVTRDQPWRRFHLGNPVYNLVLQLLFEYGVAIQYLQLHNVNARRRDQVEFERRRAAVLSKASKQITKDYVIYPALTGPAWRTTLTANLLANAIRNVWSNMVIFCGHFPDGAEKFTRHDLRNETKGQWYLRQMLGSANISGGRLMTFMTGNLDHQIEHHLFPDIPSNRYREVAVRVRALTEKYDLPYTTGPLLVQYGKAWRTIFKLSVPNKYLKDSADNAPETHSERMFGQIERGAVNSGTGRRRGLRTALREHRGHLVTR
ncbi:fatty acid desaturase family protein [Smaragdicoccus niigatensis]|uniref:fatty acid desaturase family protein n=1 Tax=Smaragdicoccus niigatensis TaxID=359359 RepID=UPI000370F509|nr:fatty acid desaturase [Smaragdicoccus niigatensis]